MNDHETRKVINAILDGFKIDIVKDFAHFLIDKGGGEVIYTADLPEYVLEYLEKEGAENGN